MSLSTEQALERMRLDAGASPTDVERRFRELASPAHPDHGGTADAFGDLLAARDHLLRVLPGQELLRFEDRLPARAGPPGELMTLDRTLDGARRRAQESDRVTKSLVRAQVTRLNRSRRLANFLAWLGGGASGIALALRMTTLRDTGEFAIDAWITAVVLLFLVLAAGCGAAGFMIGGKISRIEQAIEEAAETMGDRATFVKLLYEIVDPTSDAVESPAWTAEELTDLVKGWSDEHAEKTAWRLGRHGDQPGLIRLFLLPLKGLWGGFQWLVLGRLNPTPTMADLAFIAGSADFTRLLIAKGAENGLLVPDEEVRDGRLHVRHRLNLEPVGSS